jgi:hypothetical protein
MVHAEATLAAVSHECKLGSGSVETAYQWLGQCGNSWSKTISSRFLAMMAILHGIAENDLAMVANCQGL